MFRAFLFTLLGILCLTHFTQRFAVGYTIAAQNARESLKPEKPITKTYEELQMPAVGSSPNAWNDNNDWELVTPQTAAAAAPSQWHGNWFSRRQFGNDPFFNSHSSFPSSQQPSYLFNNDRTNPFDDTQKPGTVTKTTVDDKGNRVITSYSSGPTHWTTQTMMYPSRTWSYSGTNFPTLEGFPNINEVPSLTPSTTSARPVPSIETTAATTTVKAPSQLPTLDEFLESQYGTKRTTQETPTPKATTPLPNLDDFINSLTTPTLPVSTIRIEDIPVTTVLTNGKEADDEFLSRLPKDLRPSTTLPTNTFKVENIPQSESGTSHTTLRKTVTGPNLPTVNDLDPNMREILEKANINPEDVNPLTGNTITKTRTEPDGRQITTTYRVQTMPALPGPAISSSPMGSGYDSNFFQAPAQAPSAYSPPYPSAYPWSRYIPSYQGNPFNSAVEPFENTPSLTPHVLSNPIDVFLSKIGITPKQILNNNSEFVKTIVDDNGRVLTATFVLSTIKGVPEEPKPTITPEPIK